MKKIDFAELVMEMVDVDTLRDYIRDEIADKIDYELIAEAIVDNIDIVGTIMDNIQELPF